jgi:hypothetical protein
MPSVDPKRAAISLLLDAQSGQIRWVVFQPRAAANHSRNENVPEIAQSAIWQTTIEWIWRKNYV